MDPQDANKVFEIIENKGMSILGWYHSHPIFEVNPSNIDVNTHETYQSSFHKDNKPFIGVIVGPYSKIIDHKIEYTSLIK